MRVGSSSMPQLTLNPGLSNEQIFEIRDGVSTIGRTDDNAICVPHKSVSRRHARIESVGERVSIIDLDSKNGTFVNGDSIKRSVLTHGDTLKCGDVALGFTAMPMQSTAMPTFVRDIRLDFTRSAPELLANRTSIGVSALKVTPIELADRYQAKLQILLRVSELLSSPESIDVLLEKILDQVFQLLDVDRAALLLVDELTGKLEPRIVKTVDGRMSMGNVNESRIYSNNIVEYVREHSVAALFSDARMDPRLGQAKSIIYHSICASMCAPLKPRDSVIGVLYVDNTSVPDRFSEEDLEFITAFANQAAIAIENSRLNQRLADEAVIRNNFLRFFPPAALKRMTENKSFRLETIETEVTALFCDISAFTAMSARMEPREVVDLLNDYFPVMSQIVFRYEGTLEKYIGDALMAVWGAPFANPDDAERAVRAAIEMHRALRGLNVELMRKRNLAIQIHVGLNTGRVAAGNIGSDQYIQYATIGDATNVASRICSAAVDGELLISEVTFAKLTPGLFKTEKLEPIRVKGKDDALQVYRVRWDLDGSGQS